MTIRVLVADDEPTLRAAVCDLIDSERDLELVGVASDAIEAVKLARDLRPDLAILDVKMPGGGGAHAAREIRRCAPNTRIVALSAFDDRGAVLEMLRAGANGYLVKDGRVDDFVEAIRRASANESVLSAQVASSVVEELVGRVQLEASDEEQRDATAALVRRALDEPGAISISFQSIFDLRSNVAVGAEALARFDIEPLRTPDKWFADAAAVGLAHDLEVVAVRAALSQLHRLPPSSYMSLNVSPTTLASTAFIEIMEVTRADRVVIEMTEHAPVEDYEAVRRPLNNLRRRGFRFAIDDAGAGFASLRHILSLDPDIIKLDVSLTRDVDATPAKRALAAALASFGREIGSVVVAEGIETQRELETLRDLGVTHGQGYFLGRPAPLPEESAA